MVIAVEIISVGSFLATPTCSVSRPAIFTLTFPAGRTGVAAFCERARTSPVKKPTRDCRIGRNCSTEKIAFTEQQLSS